MIPCTPDLSSLFSLLAHPELFECCVVIVRYLVKRNRAIYIETRIRPESIGKISSKAFWSPKIAFPLKHSKPQYPLDPRWDRNDANITKCFQKIHMK